MRRFINSVLVLLSASIGLLASGSSASAGFFPAQAIDGPSAEIVGGADVDIARDGQGAVVYIRNDAGVPHVFVARFTGGRFGPPQRLDGGFSGPASQPVVGVADNGRIAVAYLTADTLVVTVFDPSTGNWSTAQGLSAGASNPSIDLSIHGAGFVTYTAGGDVRAARLERTAQQFAPVDAILDLEPGQGAGEGAGRSRVAIGADGTAVAVWGEGGRVVARRLYRTRVSTAPIDLTLGDLEGRAGGAADLPEVSIEDDSSFAQVAFRQQFSDGGAVQSRAVVRRLRGSAVDAPAIIDGQGWGGSQVDAVDIHLNGRGDGGAAVALSGGVVAASLVKNNNFGPITGVGTSGGIASPKIITAETTQHVVSWLSASDGTVRSRFYDDRQSLRTFPSPGAESLASYQDFGPVDLNAGLDSDANRVGDFMSVFVQGTGESRRLVYSAYDRAPVAFSQYTSSAWRNPSVKPLSWAPAMDLWGGAAYIVTVDGREIGRTTSTKFTIPLEALVGEGVHNWKVTAIDQRGQAVSTKVRSLKLDSVPPTGLIQLTRKKRTVTARVVAADVLPPSGRAAGVATVTLSFGDGSKPLKTRGATRTYPGTKRAFTIVAKITDKAGNVTEVERAIVLPKQKSKKRSKS